MCTCTCTFVKDIHVVCHKLLILHVGKAIEIAVPKLESYTSYDVITKAVTASGDKLKEFNTSTTSSDGITDKRARLKVTNYAYVYVCLCS